MKVEIPSVSSREALGKALGSAAMSEKKLPNFPLTCIEIIRSQNPPLSLGIRGKALGLIRDWTNYVREHDVSEVDPFLIRHHVSQFAEKTFGKQRKDVELQEVDIGSICRDNQTYSGLMENYVPLEIFKDKHVALFGGVARLALKMHAGVDIESELPPNDIDIIVSSRADLAAKAKEYKADLPGVKTVDGDVGIALLNAILNSDCMMNQTAAYNGKLLFTKQALQDVKDGNIRIIAKDDPLFGSQGISMPNGNVYLTREGFYRGLTFLLRGQGKRLIISRENLEAEKHNIGRYWAVMMFVKILPMKDEDRRKEAIANWHEIACRIGSTQTQNPEQFLKELMLQHPDTKNYNGATQTFDINKQVRWIIGKLTAKAVDEIYGSEKIVFPSTYTEANLELSEKVPDFDDESYESFVETVENTSV